MYDPNPIWLTALYVPANRPDRFEKACSSGADLVVLDLEDSVLPADKVGAREAVLVWLAQATRFSVSVRVNQLDSPWGKADLQALGDFDDLHSVRLPKVEDSRQVAMASELLGAGISCLIESALGVERAFDIASAAGTVAIALGEADLRSDIGVTAPDGLSWARSRIVLAAAAAKLPPPAMSVYTSVTDDEGLRLSCREGRRHGFVGRSAVHPRQLQPILEGFRPSELELKAAQDMVNGIEHASSQGLGVTLLADGRLADSALLAQSQRTLAIEAAVMRQLAR